MAKTNEQGNGLANEQGNGLGSVLSDKELDKRRLANTATVDCIGNVGSTDDTRVGTNLLLNRLAHAHNCIAMSQLKYGDIFLYENLREIGTNASHPLITDKEELKDASPERSWECVCSLQWFGAYLNRKTKTVLYITDLGNNWLAVTDVFVAAETLHLDLFQTALSLAEEASPADWYKVEDFIKENIEYFKNQNNEAFFNLTNATVISDNPSHPDGSLELYYGDCTCLDVKYISPKPFVLDQSFPDPESDPEPVITHCGGAGAEPSTVKVDSDILKSTGLFEFGLRKPKIGDSDINFSGHIVDIKEDITTYESAQMQYFFLQFQFGNYWNISPEEVEDYLKELKIDRHFKK